MDAVLNDRLLKTTEAAIMLGVEPETLAVWRLTKRYDLPYVKVGSAVRYRLSDVQNWIERQTVRS